ncbi:unnamed protein product [Arctia plantaginis]|uniref:Uncharacterized protein n=1 Tax=Arctia plantaginis TaxID=874455 RepID=A0A8S0ZIK7_ARCPL|nr:unnamed protein product [Arctia plantaginis]
MNNFNVNRGAPRGRIPAVTAEERAKPNVARTHTISLQELEDNKYKSSDRQSTEPIASDEDKLDYSSGSSNNWSRKESESSSEEEMDIRKRKVKKNSHVEIKKKEKPGNKR